VRRDVVPARPRLQRLRRQGGGRRPSEIVLGKHGSFSFYGLEWRSFGARNAYAIGRAAIRKGKQEWNPRASVRLSFLIEDGPDRGIYSIVRYVLHGSVPRGFDRHGFRAVG
jgi:hypothetical protein